MEEVEVEKMVKLAEQCLERIKSFLGKRNETSVPNSSTALVQTSSPQITPQTSTKASGEHCSLHPWYCWMLQNRNSSVFSAFLEAFNEAEMDPSKLYMTEQNSQHRRVLSDGKGEDCPFLPPELFQKLQVVESQDNKKLVTHYVITIPLNNRCSAESLYWPADHTQTC